VSQVFQKGECPACLEANTATLDDDIEAELDGENGEIYCAGSEPLGDDDAGFVPLDGDSLKCELVVHKNLVTLRKCASKCVEKLAAFGPNGPPFALALSP